MKLSDSPTPQEVLDFYDLHTGDGTVNFSNADAGLSVQLWHSLAQALEENQRLGEAINKALSVESPSVTEIVTDWDTRMARTILSDALKEGE